MSQMLMAIFVAYSTSGVTSGKKLSSQAQNGGHFGNVKVFNTASIWHQKWKDSPKLCKKKYFHGDDVIDDVTERPQSRFSIFLYEWKNNIFHDNWRTYIAQIAPLSFQGSHRTQTQTSEVRWLHASVVTEWSPACLHEQFPGDLHRGNYRKPQIEDVHNFINIGPTNPIQILNQHEIFWRFCMCNSIDTFDKNKKYWSRYWGSTAKTGSLLGIKQT